MAQINRRDFLKRIGLTGAVIAGTGTAASLLHDTRSAEQYLREARQASALRLKSFQVPREPSAPGMAIIHGADPDRLVRAALDALGGVKQFIRSGDVVIIKPNVAFDRAPALGATSSPGVVAAVVRLCREAGARQVMVLDNPINQPEGCFLKSGVQRAAEEAGATVILPQASAFAPVEIGGEVLKTWPMFYRPFRDADKVIGIAPCKDHNLCGASLTMKNWYGLLGGMRNQFHQNIHGVIADFPLLMKPTLVILDGTHVLLSNGPTGGSLSDVAKRDTLVAGVDMVAVDAYGYTLLGRDPEKLEYLKKAHARGLGNMHWKSTLHKEVRIG